MKKTIGIILIVLGILVLLMMAYVSLDIFYKKLPNNNTNMVAFIGGWVLGMLVQTIIGILLIYFGKKLIKKKA
ncbi:MAG: hypothetical protein J0L80_16255 [Chitinophagales bacterium]|nr:hypothetical protein [Chitinophagales bacterium]